MKQKIGGILSICFGLFFLLSFGLLKNRHSFFNIPKQGLHLFHLIGDTSQHRIDTVAAFQISKQVSYREYKVYLSEIRRDSSELFYLLQLPDTNIGNPVVRKKYLTSNAYDDFPVLGISWESAMNFCKWKTLNENKDSIRFIYRLPKCSEWLAANHYLTKNKINNDFNKNYADWLINEKIDAFYVFKSNLPPFFPYDMVFFHNKKTSNVLKRKDAIGNSYFYNRTTFLDQILESNYAHIGYKYIAFRYVKTSNLNLDVVTMKYTYKEQAVNLLDYCKIN